MARQTKHSNIPEDLMQRYLAREITSAQLAEATGYSAVYLRRSIKRDESTYLRNSVVRPRSGKEKGWENSRKELLRARKAYRESVSHLPIKEIMDTLKVSKSTAYRLKKAKK